MGIFLKRHAVLFVAFSPSTAPCTQAASACGSACDVSTDKTFGREARWIPRANIYNIYIWYIHCVCVQYILYIYTCMYSIELCIYIYTRIRMYMYAVRLYVYTL